MVRVWLIAALAACSTAGADDRAAPALPAGWQPLPAMAAAVSTAVTGDPVAVDRAFAGGDPARGCYAVWLDLRAGRADESALADAIVAGLKPIAVHDVTLPSRDSQVLALGFDKPPYRGRLRARLGAGRVNAVACFANEREPARCETTCTKLLEAP